MQLPPCYKRKSSGGARERTWRLDPEEWTRVFDVLVFVIQVVFAMIRLMARFRAAVLWCVAGVDGGVVRGGLEGERKEVGGVEGGRLGRWKMVDGGEVSSVGYEYPTWFDRLESVFMSSLYMGYCRHIAGRVRKGGGDGSTAMGLKAAVGSIRVRALQSNKFRESFREMVGFIEDLEASSEREVALFLDMLAMDMLSRRSWWNLQFLHTHSRGRIVKKEVYETTLAIFSVFHREGAGIEWFLLRGKWKDWRGTLNGALTLTMHYVMDRCISMERETSVARECSGAEQLLQATSGEGFRRLASTTRTRDEWLFKDRMMLDISLNCCNEYVESSWSVSSMERAIWALQYARRYMSRELYEELKEYSGKRNLDLTHLNPLLLITMSMIGLIRFEGLNDCVYQMTKSSEAPVVLHGNMPMPTILELLSLHLLRRHRNGSYGFEQIPGSEGREYRAIHVGERIKFVTSRSTAAFSAQPEQCVG